MPYNKQLPPVHQLLSLAREISFPATREEIVRAAMSWGYEDMITDFINLFSADEIFESRVDFMTRCEELELLIGQERKMPKELLRSPQE